MPEAAAMTLSTEDLDRWGLAALQARLRARGQDPHAGVFILDPVLVHTDPTDPTDKERTNDT